MTDLATQAGYYSNEIHLFEAPDGFILSLFRISSGDGASQPSSRGPMFMINGLNVDATFAIFQGEGSTAYVLADQGYEIWVMNPRGSVTSRAHVDRSPDGNPISCTDVDPYNNPCQLGAINTREYFQMTYETYADDVLLFYQYISEQTGYTSFPSLCISNG